MIEVTRPFLPPFSELQPLYEGIWERNWLTNNGPLVNELESKLKDYLDIPNLLFLTNGTIAIQLALKALDLSGEIITTPFSYIATSSTIKWEGMSPVFADIDPRTLNINPKKIEELITQKTTGILATHVFGNPCDIDAIEKLADKHNLKVIYDAAHCFGTKYKGKSIFHFGDISTTSFHATKLFHTVEGGAVFSSNSMYIDKMRSSRNFGHSGPEAFDSVGINAKNSEFHAAMGIANLNHIESILASREWQYNYYSELLAQPRLQQLQLNTLAEFNHAYFPIVFTNDRQLLSVLDALQKNHISPRRYFYPSLNTIDFMEGAVCEVSESISSRVLCLPMYYDLKKEEIQLVCQVILNSLLDIASVLQSKSV